MEKENNANGNEQRKETPETNGGNPTTPETKKRSADKDTPPTPEKKETRSEAPQDMQKIAAEAAKKAVEGERTRSKEIRSAVKIAGLTTDFADGLIERNLTIDEARKEILDKWEKDGVKNIRSTYNIQLSGPDEVDKRRSAMEKAILHRVGHLKDENGKTVRDVPDDARQYRGMSLFEMGRHILEEHGVDTRSLDRTKIASSSLVSFSRGALSTSDFPIILGNTINRVLRSAYDQTQRTFLPFCRRVSVSDFKQRTAVQLSGMMEALDKIPEGGEYKRATMSEAKEVWQVEKFGKIIPVTWETLINDDLTAFDRIPTAMAAECTQKQSDIIYNDIIIGNPDMGDSVALFHTATHGNLAATPAAISVASLGIARASMRKQKGLNNRFINVMPKYLIVGPDKETEAEQILSGIIVPIENAKVNPFKGSLDLIVEPRLTGNQWYLSAAPMLIDTIDYGFLDGQELFTEQREGFDIDGMEVKVRMVFGAKAIDWRGLYKNAGA